MLRLSFLLLCATTHASRLALARSGLHVPAPRAVLSMAAPQEEMTEHEAFLKRMEQAGAGKVAATAVTQEVKDLLPGLADVPKAQAQVDPVGNLLPDRNSWYGVAVSSGNQRAAEPMAAVEAPTAVEAEANVMVKAGVVNEAEAEAEEKAKAMQELQQAMQALEAAKEVAAAERAAAQEAAAAMAARQQAVEQAAAEASARQQAEEQVATLQAELARLKEQVEERARTAEEAAEQQATMQAAVEVQAEEQVAAAEEEDAAAAPAEAAAAVVSPSASVVIDKAKAFIACASGYYSPVDPSFYDEDFVFRAALIGPLTKADYMRTMSTLRVYTGFPDLAPNAFGFTVDPTEPLRVWFWTRATGTFTQPWKPFGKGADFLALQPNGALARLPTESFSITFTPEGKVRFLTVGYVANRWDMAVPEGERQNTGGYGAVLGLFYAAGQKQLATIALSDRFRAVGNWLANTNAGSGLAKTKSNEEDLPAWYREE